MTGTLRVFIRIPLQHIETLRVVMIAGASTGQGPPDPLGLPSQPARQIVVLTSDSVLVPAIIRVFPMHGLSGRTLWYSAGFKVE